MPITTHTYTHTHTHMCVYVCICIYICTCMYACMYVCVYMYTHTHTHTHTHTRTHTHTHTHTHTDDIVPLGSGSAIISTSSARRPRSRRWLPPSQTPLAYPLLTPWPAEMPARRAHIHSQLRCHMLFRVTSCAAKTEAQPHVGLIRPSLFRSSGICRRLLAGILRASAHGPVCAALARRRARDHRRPVHRILPRNTQTSHVHACMRARVRARVGGCRHVQLAGVISLGYSRPHPVTRQLACVPPHPAQRQLPPHRHQDWDSPSTSAPGLTC
jgi:hypothetical protein